MKPKLQQGKNNAIGMAGFILSYSDCFLALFQLWVGD